MRLTLVVEVDISPKSDLHTTRTRKGVEADPALLEEEARVAVEYALQRATFFPWLPATRELDIVSVTVAGSQAIPDLPKAVMESVVRHGGLVKIEGAYANFAGRLSQYIEVWVQIEPKEGENGYGLYSDLEALGYDADSTLRGNLPYWQSETDDCMQDVRAWAGRMQRLYPQVTFDAFFQTEH